MVGKFLAEWGADAGGFSKDARDRACGIDVPAMWIG
jgi:hypothetical protein